MKKRLLFFFVGLVCSLVAMADETTYTYGIHRALTDGKLGVEENYNPSVTGVTYACGSFSNLQAMTDKDRTCYHGSSTKLTAPKGIKNYRTSSAKTNTGTQYYDFSLTVANGYAVDIKSITGDIVVDADNSAYQMVIYDGSGNVLYECGEKGPQKSSVSFVKTVDFTGEDIAAEKKAKVTGVTGKIVVKMHVWNTGATGKYINIIDFKINVSVYEQTQTQYQKPTITTGTYNKSTGFYPVTLTANDEDGVINYTVGSGAKVSGAASGTTINVAPATTIKATVSGSSFDESDEATFTTAAAPKLAQPTYTVDGFDFTTFKYTISLAATEGDIKYAIGEGAYSAYTDALVVAPGAVIKAKAEMANMTASDEITITVPAAPVDGVSETPTTANTYTDGMTYNAGAFTIPSTNGYIGSQVSSGNSSINGSIKMRMSRECDPADPKGKGFHILVNPGYVLKNVKLQILNNYTGDKANANLVAVYVDGVNKLDASVELPKATANTVQPAVVELNDIYATSKVVFQFAKVAEDDDDPNQAQVLISADALVPVYNTNLTPDGYGTMYYWEKELVCPEGTKAYTGYLTDDKKKLVLEELPNGIIPANTPAIIEGNGGLFTVGTSNAPEVWYDLGGADRDMDIVSNPTNSGVTVFVLGYENGKAGFYKLVGPELILHVNKVYLPIDGISAPAKINIIKEGEAATGIMNVNAQAKNGVMYNLAGQRVNADAKGMVIVNGKVVIKK